MFKLLLITLISVPFIVAQQSGTCPKVSGRVVDIYKARGLWYVYKLSKNAGDPTMKCGRITWGEPDGDNVNLLFNSWSTIANVSSAVVVQAKRNDNIYKFHIPVLGEIPANVRFIGIDHDRWAIVWICNDFGDSPVEKSWVLSKIKNPGEEIETFINESYKNYGLVKPEFLRSNQSC